MNENEVNNSLLIVDDDKSVINALRRNLFDEDYQLHFANSGTEALEIIKSEKIDVILSDLEMPGMDGISLLSRVKVSHPEIIRLVLSAKSDSKIVLDAINEGNVLRYITKPWEESDLINVIKQAFDLFNLKVERKKLVSQLKEHNTELEEKVRQKSKELFKIQNTAEIGKYTSQIVHNLNNPLNGILGSIQMIEMWLNKPESDLNEIKSLIQLGKESAEELEQIISSILIHVRDKDERTKEDVDINETIRGSLKLFEMDHFFKYKVTKNLELSDDLPKIPGHRLQIKQIFDNLIKNAIDAMQNAEKRELSIYTSERSDNVIVIISDTGSGIPEDKLDRIFLPEYSTKVIGKGTGLGLASVKSMVEGYHGVINVESELGKGSSFIILLPIDQDVVF